MTTEQIVRDQLERATRDVVGGPDVERAVRSGRRRRRLRRGGLAVAAVTVLGLGVVGVQAATGGDARQVAHDAPVADAPAAATSAPPDFVPGTDVDETMAAAIAEDVPSLPAPDDVYPSDDKTAGPIPDAQFAQARDWQSAYTTSDGDVLVMMGHAEELGGWRCRDCDEEKVAGGTLYRQDYSTDAGATWWFTISFVRDDGSFVNVLESVGAPDQQGARDQRHVSDAQMAALARDPRLTF